MLTLIAAFALAPAQQSNEFVDAWQQTERAIRSRYYARDARKEEMDALLTKYSQIAPKVSSRGQFRDVVLQMIDEFGDSHFDFLTPADQGFYAIGSLVMSGDQQEMPNVGAWFVRREGAFVVQMVMEGMAAEEAGLRRGDIVKSVNGKKFSPVESLLPLVDETASFVVSRDGEEFTVEMEVEEHAGMDMFLRATRNSRRIIESGDKTFGYLHLWTMSGDKFKSALSSYVYGRAANTDGFILDLRDGFGGRPEGFADPFFRPEVKLEWIMGESVMPQMFGYQKPLIVLINKGSRSAKEVMAYIFKKSQRGFVIGHSTGGNVLGTMPQVLGDWAIIEIPMVDLYVDGLRFEGVGVEPELFIMEEFGPDGEDLFIKKAVEILDFQTKEKIGA